MPLTLADVPQELKDAIVAEYFSRRNAVPGRKRTPAKRAASRANIATVNTRRGADHQSRLHAALADVRQGVPPSKAARDARVNYTRFKRWALKTQHTRIVVA